MKKFKFSAGNLRRLAKNFKPVVVEPLTLVLGHNNAGKSTLMDTLLLLKQSLQDNSEAVVWDGNYVDFGCFDAAVRKDCDFIIFRLGLGDDSVEIRIEKNDDGIDYVSRVEYTLGDDSLIINSNDITSDLTINRNGSESTEYDLDINTSDLFWPILLEPIKTEILKDDVVDRALALKDELTEIILNVRSLGSNRYAIDRLVFNEDHGRAHMVSHDASNVPYVLWTLWEDGVLDDFNAWLKSFEGERGFHFTVDVEVDLDVLSIIIVQGDVRLNIANTGMGYHAVLPVLLTMWLNRNEDGIVLIENPEVSLHPQFQGMIMDAFASLLHDAKCRFIVETFAQPIISKCSQFIHECKLNRKLVRVVMLNERLADDSMKANICMFNAKGKLKGNWPYGFFNSW